MVYFSSGIELWYTDGWIDTTGIPVRYVRRISGARAIVAPAGALGDSRFARVSLPLHGGHLVTLLTAGRLHRLVAVAAALVRG